AKRTRWMRRNAMRELLKVTLQPEVISFAGGLPAAELFPMQRVREAVKQVLDTVGPQALQYGQTEGVGGLRDWIARQFRVQRENVLITSGAQQALDLIGRVLLNEGDRVIVENPTYLALLSAWRPLGVEFLPAPSDTDGMRVDGLEPLATPAQVHLSDAQLPESPGHNPDARAPGAINRTGAETRNGRGGRQSLWRTALQRRIPATSFRNRRQRGHPYRKFFESVDARLARWLGCGGAGGDRQISAGEASGGFAHQHTQPAHRVRIGD